MNAHDAHEITKLERGRELSLDEIRCLIADHQTSIRHATADPIVEAADILLRRLEDVNAAAASEPVDATKAHGPGNPWHHYRIECEVCGAPGTLQLSIEPQGVDGFNSAAESILAVAATVLPPTDVEALRDALRKPALPWSHGSDALLDPDPSQ